MCVLCCRVDMQLLGQPYDLSNLKKSLSAVNQANQAVRVRTAVVQGDLLNIRVDTVMKS